MNKYELWDYFDVYGNETDGFEVNNLCKIEDDIVFADDCTKDEIIDFLKRIEFLTDKCTPDDFSVEFWNPDFIEIFLNNGYPVCSFRKQY